MFPEKFMRFNFEAEPKSSRYSLVIGLYLLHVFTNPVVRHGFGAPLKHKYGIDSWILRHSDEWERLLLLFIRIMRALMAKMMAPLHIYNIQYKVFIKFNLGDYWANCSQ